REDIRRRKDGTSQKAGASQHTIAKTLICKILRLSFVKLTKNEKRRLMQVVVCSKCGAKNRVDESKLATSEAKW
ncbi:MAG TPA: hypothetical protein VK274_05900, partial [Pyrinomonadaceae bacterium]|nr:hypothetical protein [Pyrinomonadaceae bacterium]